MDGTWRLVCSKMLCWSAEGLARLAGGASPTDNYVLEVFSSRGMSDGGRVLTNFFQVQLKRVNTMYWHVNRAHSTNESRAVTFFHLN